jgi:pimeloyl-ACP methyl ester carboxylesterase
MSDPDRNSGAKGAQMRGVARTAPKSTLNAVDSTRRSCDGERRKVIAMKCLARCVSLATAAICAVGSSESIASARAPTVSLSPFYEEATKLIPDGKLGQVLAKESVSATIAGAEAWRIAYVSSDTLDRKTVVTALIVAPKGDVPKGGRPIVSWAHGTTGTAENCGPSQVINPAQSLNQYFLVGGNSWTDYGIPAIETFIKLGYVIVATDYQGLGGGGVHQYAVAMTQARDAIDAIRAVGAMGLAGRNKKAVIYGWSQGGGATVAAASLPAYLSQTGTAYDEVDMVGFVALAPQDVAAVAPHGADAEKTYAALVGGFTGNVFDFTHLAMTLWANAAAFPNLKLVDVFTDWGAEAIDDIMRNKCIHAAADTIHFTFGGAYKSLLKEKPTNAEAWIKALVDESVPAVKPVAPVIIYWGTADTTVPPIMGKLYREQMCALGGNVTRIKLSGEQTHYTTPGASEPLYAPWIRDRFDGKATPDGCAAPDD